MHAIGPAVNATNVTTPETRRRIETAEASVNESPPAPANDRGIGGRPVMPAAAAYDPSRLAEDSPPAEAERDDAPQPVAEARPVENDDADSAESAVKGEDAPEPKSEAPMARLEVIDVQGRLGAPITAYDNSESPPTLVIYV